LTERQKLEDTKQICKIIVKSHMGRKKIMVLTGAGISKESGIETFRDSKDGLWNNFKIDELATKEAWYRKGNRENMLEFYNERRRQVGSVEPNDAHKGLVELEKNHDVYIITQNIDDLHERAGSSNILHLHGEITKARSSAIFHSKASDEDAIHIGYDDIKIGDKCENGSQLRPHVVWFGEDVPNLPIAAGMVKEADVLVIIGTSFTVYPAAMLMTYAKKDTPIYIIDPSVTNLSEVTRRKCTLIQKKATEGVAELLNILNGDVND
jgi:NAD-dependent deacetylase